VLEFNACPSNGRSRTPTGRPVVAASDSSFEQAKTFAAAATARRPFAIFRELHHARQWLNAQSLPDD